MTTARGVGGDDDGGWNIAWPIEKHSNRFRLNRRLIDQRDEDGLRGGWQGAQARLNGREHARSAVVGIVCEEEIGVRLCRLDKRIGFVTCDDDDGTEALRGAKRVEKVSED